MYIKQNVGIDIAKKDFKVCFMSQVAGQEMKIKGTRTFLNTAKGFKELYQWAKKKRDLNFPLHFTMEATGVYYESLAYFLKSKKDHVSVLLPNKSSNYIKSLNLKSKTDALEAKALAQMGVERSLMEWEPVSAQMYEIKILCRERVALVEDKTKISNRLHAEQHRHHSSKATIKRFKQQIALIDKHIKAIEKEIQKLVEKDDVLNGKVKQICQMKGLKITTVITVIAETNGFALIKNKAQLVSYTGYDVVEKQSGSSVNGKTKISKKGNRFIRRALHFPALTVVKYYPEFNNLHSRIHDRTKIKMKGYTAVQRKLLVLIYTLFKNNEAYDPKIYQQRLEAQQKISRQDTNLAYAG